MKSWDRHNLPIGEVIFLQRTAINLTQEELGKKTGIHPNTIIRIEKGERPPSLGVLQRISAGLGVELWRLIRKAESIRPPQHVVG